MTGVVSYSPADVAYLLQEKGVSKATAPVVTTLAMAVLAGAFIALGAVFSTTIGSDANLGFGPTRLLMGLGFSLGLILVIVAGAELFTGNNLVVMSWVSRRISLLQLLRNWGIVYVGNLIGALSIVVMVYYANWWTQDGHSVGATALSIANGKAGLSFQVTFVRGILANALVCLAVWLAMAGRTIIDKAVRIVFPVATFVAGGFEHSIANMYFLPLGLLLSENADVLQAAGLTGNVSRLTIPWSLNNLAAAPCGTSWAA